MARIRSLHPGQWTDENFVQCSPLARLLALAIRNEADDNGAFEWKPITIKMRLFPADNVDVEALLSELEQHSQVEKYEVDGRQYGLIRNFKKFQRPKEPKYIHPTPTTPGSEQTLTHPTSEDEQVKVTSFPGNAEIVPQRKEVGGNGRRKEEKKDTSADADGDFDEFYQAYPRHEGKGQALKAYRTARKKADKPTLLAGAIRARERYATTERQFIPLPASWLNGERWLDENPPPNGSGDDTIYRGVL